MTTPDRPAAGIRRKRAGWQAFIKIGGRVITKQFPADTPVPTMKRWRDQQRARHTLHLPVGAAAAGTFAADCARYLQAVAGMPTIKDRTYRIGEWKKVFGARPRAEITPLEIQAQLETWRRRGMSAGTLNLRRTALAHLFTTLDRDIAGAVNPVRAVPHYREVVRPLTLPTLAEAVRAVRAARHAYAKRADSKTFARLQVLLWTGWPAALLKQLRPVDVDWKAGTATLHPRTKGAGTRTRCLPLLPQALAALKTFKRLDAWGPFDNHSLRRALRHGCRKIGITPFTTYALRHLFLTTVATAAQDDRVVAELAMHADIRQTRRYTEASVNPRVHLGLQRVADALTQSGQPKARAGNLSPSRATRSGPRRLPKAAGG